MVFLFGRNSARITPLPSQKRVAMIFCAAIYFMFSASGTQYAATARTAACSLVCCVQFRFHRNDSVVENLFASFVITKQNGYCNSHALLFFGRLSTFVIPSGTKLHIMEFLLNKFVNKRSETHLENACVSRIF